MPHRRIGRALLAAVLVTGALAACAPADAIAPTPTPTAVAVVRGHREVPENPVSFAVVGDSISAWDPAYANVNPWQTTAGTLPVRFVGGWARPGATTAEMLAESAGVLPAADVLVVMAGTNDLLPQFADHRPASTLARIAAIVRTAGIARVVLSAIAPNDLRPDETILLNAHLSALASAEGWTWVDPWIAVRQPDGTYTSGTTTDGVHPQPATARLAGIALHTAIVDAALASAP